MGENELIIAAESAGTRQTRMTVELPEERVQQEMQTTARQIAEQANIPGFRKGKAPYAIIAQRYGEEAIRRETAERMLEPVYHAALERENIQPYASANLDKVELAPMRFTFTIPLQPAVDLGDYLALRVKSGKVRVTKEEVARVLEALRQEHAVLEPIEDRAAQSGDAAVIAVEGRTENGKVFMKDDEAEILLDVADEYPLPGFHQALIGMAIEEERTFRLDKPEGEPPEQFEFTARLLRLFNRTLPAVDDDLARTVGNFDNLKDLQKNIEERLREQKRLEAEGEYTENVINKALEQATIEYPPDALEEELDDFVEQFGKRVQREQRMSLADFLKVAKKSEQELRDELRPQAERRLRQFLLLREVIVVEKLQVESEELAAAIANLPDATRGRFQKEEDQRLLATDLLVRKAVDRLVAIARGEADKPAVAEAQEQPPATETEEE